MRCRNAPALLRSRSVPNRFALCLALAFLGVSGCPKARDSSNPTSVERRAESGEPAASVTVAPAPDASLLQTTPESDASSPAGVDEIIGTLGTSKGFASLGGVLLRGDEVQALLGQDWRSLVGRRVRARGRRHDYRCGPHEQCLINGVIPLLTDLVSLELCQSGVSGEAGGVDCPVSDAELNLCLASCKRQSDDCDKSAKSAKSAKGNRADLRRCGCAWISCKSECKNKGVALFACQ